MIFKQTYPSHEIVDGARTPHLVFAVGAAITELLTVNELLMTPY